MKTTHDIDFEFKLDYFLYHLCSIVITCCFQIYLYNVEGKAKVVQLNKMSQHPTASQLESVFSLFIRYIPNVYSIHT